MSFIDEANEHDLQMQTVTISREVFGHILSIFYNKLKSSHFVVVSTCKYYLFQKCIISWNVKDYILPIL